jgi:hypothetical protein
MRLNEAQVDYARAFYELYPEFGYTRALYLDFEGSGGGSEKVLSAFWPQYAGNKRFFWIRRRKGRGDLGKGRFKELLRFIEYRRDMLDWVVVFSGVASGEPAAGRPAERNRLLDWLGEDPFADVKWANMHAPLGFRQAPVMRRAIRNHRNVWRRGEKRTRYSLEALEYEFGIRRKPAIRSADNEYKDGKPGLIKPLETEGRWERGDLTKKEQGVLRDYCKQDVASMFEIAKQMAGR